MKHLIVIITLIALSVSCKASILGSSVRKFDSVNSIIKRSFSRMYQIHDRFIDDPLSKEDKTYMNRFMENGFAPEFRQEHITKFNQCYKKLITDMDGLESIKEIYFKKEFLQSLSSVSDMFIASCPEFPASLALPIDRNFFIKKVSHSNLTKEQLKQCGHFLTDISNMYCYAYKNKVPILYALEKSVLLERFLVTFFTRFGFQVDQNINAALDELSKGMRGLILPHYYTYPSDPFGFYVHQVAGLMFIEMEKYRK